MRRRDFLKGLAAVCGVGALPNIAECPADPEWMVARSVILAESKVPGEVWMGRARTEYYIPKGWPKLTDQFYDSLPEDCGMVEVMFVFDDGRFGITEAPLA